MAEVVYRSEYWDVMDAQPPLAGAEHHWLLVPRILGVRAQDDFWHVLAQLRSVFGFTYWCMASRSWEGGRVHVVVADMDPSVTVKFEFGDPPAAAAVEPS